MKKKGIIYKAQNKENGLVYIGATTHTVAERKADHIQKSNKGNGGYFQEAIGTYGPEAFSWEQIDTANDVDELAAKEKEYILKYQSQNAGYNRDSGGGGFKKTVYQYSPSDGKLVATYADLQSASKAVNAAKKSISNACLGYNRSCNGYYWSYTLTEPFIVVGDQRKRAVCQFDLKGQKLAEYDSVADASRATGLSKTCIARCCRGERDKSGGHIWKYK